MDRSIVRPIARLAVLSAIECRYVRWRENDTEEGRTYRDEWESKRNVNLRHYARSRTTMSIEYFEYYLEVFSSVLASYHGYCDREFSFKYVDREIRTYELCFYAVNDRVIDFIYVPPDVQDEAMVNLVRVMTKGRMLNFYRYIRRDLMTETDSRKMADSDRVRLVSPCCYLARRMDEMSRNRRCAVCMEKGADVKLVPCGHRCYCRNCAFRVLRECVICQKLYK